MNYVSQENLDRIVTEMAKSVGSGTGNGLEDWQAEHEYKDKDICVYEGQIYRAKVGFTSDTTFSTTQILEEYEPVGGETIIPYEQDTEISIDDIVSYDNNTYKALYNFVCGEEFSLYALEEYVPIELTDDDIKEIVGAYNPVFEEAKGINYSTTEQRIGTWIDGKPLYQKTVQFTLPSATGEQIYSFLSDIPFNNIDILVDVTGFVISSSGWRVSYEHFENGNTFLGIDWNKTTERLWFYVSNVTVSQPATLTFKYTKKNDGLNYLFNFKIDENGILDLEGNTWTNSGVTYNYSNEVNKYVMNFDKGDALYITNGLQENIGSSEDFTLYCKFKLGTSNATWARLFDNIQSRNPIVPEGSVVFGNETDSSVEYFRFGQVGNSGGSEVWNQIKFAVTASELQNGFHSIAITRKNGTRYIFYDGILKSTDTNNQAIILNGYKCIIGYPAYGYVVGEAFNGSISDYYLIKGTALWTSDFTPPTNYLPQSI